MSQKNETVNITIEPLSIIHSKRLAEVIGTDEKLNMQLSPSKPLHESSAEDFYNFCISWCKRTNSDSYAVLLDGVSIGLISISHQNYETRTAKCGYWIESRLWGREYTTKALELIIKEAQIQLSAS